MLLHTLTVLSTPWLLIPAHVWACGSSTARGTPVPAVEGTGLTAAMYFLPEKLVTAAPDVQILVSGLLLLWCVMFTLDTIAGLMIKKYDFFSCRPSFINVYTHVRNTGKKEGEQAPSPATQG